MKIITFRGTKYPEIINLENVCRIMQNQNIIEFVFSSFTREIIFNEIQDATEAFQQIVEIMK
jgi:hypothetical protein